MEQCLCSVFRALDNLKGEVFVVDNNSSDGSVAYLSPLFPSVNFIENDTNVGFAKACNQPLNIVSGRYVLYLNPDTIVTENSLSRCIAFLNAHTSTGLVGCRMIDGSGQFLPESKRSFPSVSAAFFKLSGLSNLFPSSAILNRYALGSYPQNEDCAVDVLCGAFMMGSTEKIRALNGFDESFFMYGEDIDLCYRMVQAGNKNYYLGTVTIVHFKGESAQQQKLKHRRHFYHAMQIFIKKNTSSFGKIFIAPMLTIAIIARAVLSFIFLPVLQMKKWVMSRSDAHLPKLNSRIAKEACSCGIKTFGKAKLFAIGNKISATDAICMMSATNGNGSYFWHYCGSLSVVGSDDKNETGCAFAISDQ